MMALIAACPKPGTGLFPAWMWMVLAHARALFAAPDLAAVAADLSDPVAVLADPELRAVIDPTEPECVVLAAILHFLDAGTAREVTTGYGMLIAPGNCLVIS